MKRPPYTNPIIRAFAATLALLALTSPAVASEVREGSEIARNLPATLADGTHLYGESATPDELGKSYAVFVVEGDRISGAFYQPRSSFDCFRGTVEENQLALNVTDSYTGETFPYTVAFNRDALVASAEDVPMQTSLADWHSLDEISDRDRAILKTCQVR